MGKGISRKKIVAKASNSSGGGGGTGNMNTSVYDPAGLSRQILVTPLTITKAQAVALEAGPTYPIEGQSYIINTVGITGVTQILTRGVRDATTGNVIFDVNCQAYLDDGASTIVGYFPCTYVVSTGKISVTTKIVLLVTQAGSNAPLLVYLRNDLGLTFTPSYNTVGDYQLDISGLGIFNSIYVEQGSSTTTGNGIDYFYAYWNGASIVIECYRNTIASITRRDELLLNAPITLNAILTN